MADWALLTLSMPRRFNAVMMASIPSATRRKSRSLTSEIRPQTNQRKSTLEHERKPETRPHDRARSRTEGLRNKDVGPPERGIALASSDFAKAVGRIMSAATMYVSQARPPAPWIATLGTMKAPGPNIALTLSPKTPPRPKRRSSAFTYHHST